MPSNPDRLETTVQELAAKVLAESAAVREKVLKRLLLAMLKGHRLVLEERRYPAQNTVHYEFKFKEPDDE